MKVFVSSVRRGLEEERDALPGLIRAVGHEPVRFEDYTAQVVPSREACLAGIADADVYLLLLGPHYGHRFEDTDQSPTHDEWVAARAAGMPRLVYRKTGVDFDADQEQFASMVGEYTTGAFYDTFAAAPELLTKVAAKLRELEQQPPALSFSTLPGPVSVTWRREFENAGRHGVSSDSLLDVHIVPTGGTSRSARLMSDLAGGFAARVRAAGMVRDQDPVQVSRPDGCVQAEFPRPTAAWNAVRAAQLLGVRVQPNGQVSAWSTLPGDGLGSVLDERALTHQVAGLLRLVGGLRVVDAENVAVAVGVEPTTMLAEGRVDQLPRSSASLGIASDRLLRVEPDEAMSIASLGTGATEAARVLSTGLIERFRRLR